MVYEYRLRTLNESCDDIHSRSSDIHKHSGMSLLRQHPLLQLVILLLESHSLMYCAVPKVATKALLTAMIYVHLRDMNEHFNNNCSNINSTRARKEQHINIHSFINELRKNGIRIRKSDEPKSVVEFVRSYLNILRFANINTTSSFPRLNPWRLSLLDSFPNLRVQSISNLSEIFFPSFTRAIFVRHPFERLASAYEERIATLKQNRIEAEPHYDAIRELICRQHQTFHIAHQRVSKNYFCKNNIPSFEHFIQYILGIAQMPSGIDDMDFHWQPYSSICQPCKFQYNFIGKYETFNDDFTYFLKRLNLSDWNIEKRHGASGHTTQYYQQLYSTLPDELICQLMRLYHEDFRLFDYRVDDYLNRTTLIRTCNRLRIFEPVATRSKNSLKEIQFG